MSSARAELYTPRDELALKLEGMLDRPHVFSDGRVGDVLDERELRATMRRLSCDLVGEGFGRALAPRARRVGFI